MLCQLAMELLHRQPTTFADLVNEEIGGVVASQPEQSQPGQPQLQESQPQNPKNHNQGNPAMTHLIGAIVVSAEIWQHRKKTLCN